MKTLLNSGLVLMIIANGLFTACDDGDEATPNASACFNYSPTEELIAGTEITFTSCSENATIFAWDFGDGHISTEENPKHTYETGGDFTVKMIASNETSIDSISKVITTISNVSAKTELLCRTWKAPVITDECGDEHYLYWTFKNTGTYTFDVANMVYETDSSGEIVKCTTEIETINANWNWLDSTETGISLLSDNGSSMPCSIIELTAQVLSFSVPNGDVITFTAE